MVAILRLLTTFAANLFRSRRQLEVEKLFLRHQLNIALRRAPRRPRLHRSDRVVLVWLTRLWPSLIGLARVVQPVSAVGVETVTGDTFADRLERAIARSDRAKLIDGRAVQVEDQ